MFQGSENLISLAAWLGISIGSFVVNEWVTGIITGGIGLSVIYMNVRSGNKMAAEEDEIRKRIGE